MIDATVERLRWHDPEIGRLVFPGGKMTLRHGFGSGLAMRPGDPPGHFWAIGDRGPNIKVRDAIRLYGLEHLAPLGDIAGAKIMPRIDMGPALAEFRIIGDAVELLRILPLKHGDGRLVTGLPNPASEQLFSEPVFDLAGMAIPPDPDGLDSEGLVALADGGFWIGDEFGPSLVRVDAGGTVIDRLLPSGFAPTDGVPALPALAARRQLNRGFEALTISDDGRSLYLAFQSPLAHPDEAAHRAARHVRIWRLDAQSRAVRAQYAYPLDPPESFARDCALGNVEQSDIKVSELLWLPGDRLLVLERGSATTKIYRCNLDAAPLDEAQLDLSTRPTLEELSARGGQPAFSVLAKTLLFSIDDHPEISADLEGMVLLPPSVLLLVNDNDFGVEGAETAFWRISLDRPAHESAYCGNEPRLA
jgi:hypothetical protein